jgi:L-ascorbate metabolism protein UlaG (beta-lactamase superfamily)
LDHPDLTLITHTHFDHFDKEAGLSNIRRFPALCQHSDESRLESYGFENIMPIENECVVFRGINIYRTMGTHGHLVLSRIMGKVSGYVLRSTNDPCLYIAGDTIWNRQVAATLQRHKPEVIIANCGAARFNVGAPITMTTRDLVKIRSISPDSVIVAVHMESVNHCRLDRQHLLRELEEVGMSHNVIIPADGQEVSCPAGMAPGPRSDFRTDTASR